MPPRSLRTGRRTPNPGAVRKGCSRPKALRFDSPLGGLSVFGTGEYTGNILQGGVALKPQDYLLDGITPLPQCIVVTSTATVAPDALTGAAAFMVHNLVLIGAGASLSASTNCKGLCGYVNGCTALRGGAHLHMDKIGKAGNFGDISPDMLLPAALKRKIATRKLKAYVVKARGAEGGVGSDENVAGNPGLAAGPMQTGGGGTGAADRGSGTTGHGGCGGPCGGGAGSGGMHRSNVRSADAGEYGGPGSAGKVGEAGAAGGGAGDPIGAGAVLQWYVYAANGAGGGLITLFAAHCDIGSGCIVSSDGAMGGVAATNTADLGCGGSAGGGCIVIVTLPGGYTNNGTVRANGGPKSYKYNDDPTRNGGPGGAGSVNIFELAA